MTDELARAQLAALLPVPGALRVITATEAEGGHPDTTHPGHYVAHAVVAVEDDPARPGLVVARTAEGDWCRGRAADVLARLTEAARAAG